MYKYIAIVFLITSIYACESHEQKSNESYEQFKVEQEASKGKDSTIKVYIEKPAKVTYVVQKGEKSNEWTEFKNTIETKVQMNEDIIKNLKKTTNLNSKIYKKIAYLEKVNYDLRKYMNEYIVEEKTKRDNFQKSKLIEIQELDTNIVHLAKEQKKSK